MRISLLLLAFALPLAAQSTDRPPTGTYPVLGTALHDDASPATTYALPGPAEGSGTAQVVTGALEVSGTGTALAYVFRYTIRASPSAPGEDRSIAGAISPNKGNIWVLSITDPAGMNTRQLQLLKKGADYFLILPSYIKIKLAPPS